MTTSRGRRRASGESTAAGGVRVGIVDYLNSKPLAWDFLTGRAPANYEAVYASPAMVADGLRDALLDIGLVPSIEIQRIRGLKIVPGSCIAAQAEVRSVILVSRVPVERIHSVALDENSRTSVALVRIILSEIYGRVPEFHSCKPRIEEMLTAADAALIIGDPALEIDTSEYRILDLAGEWKLLTGLPFVFAVWAVRGDFDGCSAEELIAVFERSRERGVASTKRIAGEAARGMAVDRDLLEEYLTKNLSYQLGPRERQSLVEFHLRAARHGLTPPLQAVEFLDGSLLTASASDGRRGSG